MVKLDNNKEGQNNIMNKSENFKVSSYKCDEHTNAHDTGKSTSINVEKEETIKNHTKIVHKN